MFPRLALAALMTLPLAACDSAAMTDLRRNVGLEPAETTPAEPAGPRPPAVSPLEQPIETGDAAQPVSTAEPLTYNAAAFVAGGNAPDWNVQVAGDTATYRTAENTTGRQVQVNRIVFASGVEYIGVLDGRPFVLNMRAERCQDSVTRERYALTARLTVSGQPYGGCAMTAQPAAPASAAIDATPASAATAATRAAAG